jgi:hypothetical protein
MGSTASFRMLAAVVIVYALAMAYLESAIVVYLTGALGGQVGVLFPLRPALEAGSLVAIEVGREVATLVMIGAVGVLAGRSLLERLAWAAVVFGAWDIGYYGWLWVFAGWPGSLETTDLLFLLPVPWVGPVWSPVAVSVALVAVGVFVRLSVAESPVFDKVRRAGAGPEPFTLRSPVFARENGFSLTINQNSGALVILEKSLDLRSWLPLTTQTVSQIPFVLSDPRPTNGPAGFYRAMAR